MLPGRSVGGHVRLRHRRPGYRAPVFDSLPLVADIALFAAAAAAVWMAGIKLSDSTDVLSSRLGLGEALGGLILLAVATNLPEIAITVTAAASGAVGIATGNILGGIAIQTVVLVALDAFGTRGSRPLSYRGASLILVLEAAAVIAVLSVVVMGNQLQSLVVWRLAPGEVLIAALWVGSLLLVRQAGKGLPWQERGEAPESQKKPAGHSRAANAADADTKRVGTARAATVFGAAALVTLAGGVVLEQSGDEIAQKIGIGGVLFGATILAAATSLPELSTGLASAKLGDYKLAFSDIFGGNAFLPVLFLLAGLISGKSILPLAQPSDIYLTGLGILLTAVYLVGLILRPKRRIAGMGLDSLVVLILYAVGVIGLVAIHA
jgi:cation:H+ antiporter